jgi:hypothetical protein
MIRALLLLLLLISPGVASAADRTVGIGSFERLRVEGPFRVTVAAGPPRVQVSGDRRAIDEVDVRAEGGTLVVRMGSNGWGEQPTATDAPLTITLSASALVGVTVIGAADVTVARMKGQRVDVSVSGTGNIALAAVDADQLNLTVIGSAGIKASGHAAKARLLTNGPGTIDAGALATDDLFVRLDGAGETKAQARFSAQVVNTGLGRVTVVGNAKCSIKASAGGPVSCGPKL